MGYVAGIGGANIDLHGRADGSIVLRDSNPGQLHLSMGGVLRNVLENLARLGVPVKLASVVGDDAYGGMLRAGCEALGMGTECLFTLPGQRSSCYISLLDGAGDMLVAMSDMHIIKQLDADFVRRCLPMLNGAELVVCDANLSPAALAYLAEHCTRPLYLDPVSTRWAETVRPVLGRLDTVKPNLLEMEVLAGMPIRSHADLDAACDRLLATGLRQVFVSLGADGIYYKGPGGALHGAAPGFDRLVNATGAGDAAMAGIVWAALHKLPPRETLRCALAAALVAISGEDTINPAMSAGAIEQMKKEYLTWT